MTYVEISTGGAFVRFPTDSVDDLQAALAAMVAADVPVATIWEADDQTALERTNTGNTLVASARQGVR